MNFKESVRTKLIIAAKEYSTLLDVDFVIKSDSFVLKKKYLLRFHKDNFLHLTGVTTTLKASTFYEKCFLGTIEISDFDCDSNEEIKGKSREKLKHLQSIGSFFENTLIFQEDYRKNTIKCSVASSDGKYTLGFKMINESFNVPLTLLNRNQISDALAIKDVTIEKINKKLKSKI